MLFKKEAGAPQSHHKESRAVGIGIGGVLGDNGD